MEGQTSDILANQICRAIRVKLHGTESHNTSALNHIIFYYFYYDLSSDHGIYHIFLAKIGSKILFFSANYSGG